MNENTKIEDPGSRTKTSNSLMDEMVNPLEVETIINECHDTTLMDLIHSNQDKTVVGGIRLPEIPGTNTLQKEGKKSCES